ncbi:hypothetical protein BCR36DRAFT_443778 [Piromyces finnis]|uniref:Uncharacterized protein n=1 Tax=Piromyces finnis TaxID=1754191 RepID=A0A1Y1VEJ9_9FUNG|nr:hypothetical protein BCR36DRAFT_443778 [Piromyces finnis]|eukprot:ORX52932.1 hypothetical protein BCR36DRAFT_443778 [Piromyces finnis]
MLKTYNIYTPLSIIKAFEFNSIRNYWHLSESYDNLSKYIDMDFDGLKNDIVYLMSDKKNRIKLDRNIDDYDKNSGEYNNKHDVLVKLLHLGYLAYDHKSNLKIDYNDEKSNKLIGELFIPNEEVLTSFKVSTENNNWKKVFKKVELSKKLLNDTWNENESGVAN